MRLADLAGAENTQRWCRRRRERGEGGWYSRQLIGVLIVLGGGQGEARDWPSKRKWQRIWMAYQGIAPVGDFGPSSGGNNKFGGGGQ